MKFSRKKFEEIVAEALDELPAEIAEAMSNVSVFVEPWPSRETLEEMGLGNRFELLGLYEGVPLNRRNTSYSAVLPDRITIFQGPIEATGGGRGELKDRIKSVVVHEIAHHFGIGEKRIRELGY
ncbi:MAG: metallopeptidase family protein, partial [Candidatus Abyssubacteria bacterium]|nr:metallopeptidase family protein [Candidatus Abyssubacteria bacterium]